MSPTPAPLTAQIARAAHTLPRWLTFALLVVLSACVTAPPIVPPPPGPPITDPTTHAALERALVGSHRVPAQRERDQYRHPLQTLEFFGLREDMAVLEVWPGAGGWWTEILAPVLRDHGHYYAAQWDPQSESKFVQDALTEFRAKLAAHPELYDHVEVTALQPPTKLSPVAPGSLDMVLTFRNLHNWLAREQALDMLRALYVALKPGGVLGLKDHRADPALAVDPKANSGYVNEQFAIELAQQAGFELLARSEINANPQDTRDWEQGVWTLPPVLRLGDKDRAKYLAIGESDRFTLRFMKPRLAPTAAPATP